MPPLKLLKDEQGDDLRRRVVDELGEVALQVPEQVGDTAMVKELTKGLTGFIQLVTSV